VSSPRESRSLLAFLPDGSRSYVNAENDGNVIVVDAVKQKMILAISPGKPGTIKPMAVLLSPDAAKLYVSTGRGHQVFTIDTATNKVVGSVEVGPRPWGIALSPDGKTSTRRTGLRTIFPWWMSPQTLSSRKSKSAGALGE
jgi:YVTN family beta-propeller protein